MVTINCMHKHTNSYKEFFCNASFNWVLGQKENLLDSTLMH
jgi:hypothetical protein